MQSVPYGTLKWTWFYRVWTGDPGARQRDSGGESQKVSARRPSQGAARRPARSRPPGPSRRRGTHVRTKKPPTVQTRCPWVRETSARSRRPDLRGSTSELAAHRLHSPRATWKRAGAAEPGRAEWTTPPAAPAARAIVPAPPPPRARSREGGHGRGKAAAARAAAPAHSPGNAANGDREARSGERRRPAVAAAATQPCSRLRVPAATSGLGRSAD